MIATFSFSANLAVGSDFPAYSYKDQFDNTHTFNKEIKSVIIAFDRSGGNIVKDTLGKQEKGYLEAKRAVYIADISGMPSFVTKFFAMPKMKKYNFTMLLEFDNELSKVYPYQEDKITIIKLDSGKIKEIIYVSEGADILKNL